MSWLETQAPEILRAWLRETSIPLEVTLPDGRWLWVNKAFEDLVGRTLPELERIPGGWKTLTASVEDAADDSTMASEVVDGKRRDYRFNKEYVHKNGQRRPVEIHVLRYPLNGEFEFFLVSVLPLDLSYTEMLEKFSELQSTLVQISQSINDSQSQPPSQTWSDWCLEWFVQFREFCKDSPIPAILIILLLGSIPWGLPFVLELAKLLLGRD